MGRLLDAVRGAGIADSTLVLLVSDHGREDPKGVDHGGFTVAELETLVGAICPCWVACGRAHAGTLFFLLVRARKSGYVHDVVTLFSAGPSRQSNQFCWPCAAQWAGLGAGIGPDGGREIVSRVRTMDTAATVVRALGLQLPAQWTYVRVVI